MDAVPEDEQRGAVVPHFDRRSATVGSDLTTIVNREFRGTCVRSASVFVRRQIIGCMRRGRPPFRIRSPLFRSRMASLRLFEGRRGECPVDGACCLQRASTSALRPRPRGAPLVLGPIEGSPQTLSEDCESVQVSVRRRREQPVFVVAIRDARAGSDGGRGAWAKNSPLITLLADRALGRTVTVRPALNRDPDEGFGRLCVCLSHGAPRCRRVHRYKRVSPLG